MCVSQSGWKMEREKRKMTMICSHRNPRRRRPLDGGHCGTVRNMRDAGALRDECGFAECVWLRWDGGGGAHNCPHRWVKCKEARGGCGEEAESQCVPWVQEQLHILLCRNLKQRVIQCEKKGKKCY